MNGRATAAMCTAWSVAVLAVGCGSGGGSAHTTSAAGAASVKRLCPGAIAAEKQYSAAIAAMSLRFYDKRLEVPARKAAEALLLRARQLEHAGTDAERRKLAPFTVALSNQVKVLVAFEHKNLADVRKYGNSINNPLRQGLADLRAICAHAA